MRNGEGMRKSYLSVGKQARAELEEKKSRFVATVKPVETEGGAIAFLEGVKQEFAGANHNVYAYYTPKSDGAKRCSDDGEPRGTAGLPVLNVIEKNNLEDIAIVVTRFFGGTLLGAAGLIRAYGRAATLGVEEAGIETYTLCDDIYIMVGHTLFGAIRNEIDKGGLFVKGLEYGLDVELTVQVGKGSSDSFIKRVIDLSAGAAVVEKAGESYKTEKL